MGRTTDSRQLSIVVAAPALQITTASLPAGTVGTPYSQALAASGGTPPYTWTVSGDLPAGLSLAGNTISGTPDGGRRREFHGAGSGRGGNDRHAATLDHDQRHAGADHHGIAACRNSGDRLLADTGRQRRHAALHVDGDGESAGGAVALGFDDRRHTDCGGHRHIHSSGDRWEDHGLAAAFDSGECAGAPDHHGIAACRNGRDRLLADAGCQRRHAALHVDRDGESAARARAFGRDDLRHTGGGGHRHVHPSGDGWKDHGLAAVFDFGECAGAPDHHGIASRRDGRDALFANAGGQRRHAALHVDRDGESAARARAFGRDDLRHTGVAAPPRSPCRRRMGRPRTRGSFRFW